VCVCVFFFVSVCVFYVSDIDVMYHDVVLVS
jgi:hypothetical protein